MIRPFNRKVRMRIVIVALAASCVAVAAWAQQDNDWGPGGQTRFTKPPSSGPAPGGVRQQAEDAVKAQLTGIADVGFHDVATQVVTSVRHGAFEDRIPGPISIVCGRYTTTDPTGGPLRQAWFFVPIKHSKVLWTAVDPVTPDPGEAYYSCKNAGLAN
jgi:hypothetical protein